MEKGFTKGPIQLLGIQFYDLNGKPTTLVKPQPQTIRANLERNEDGSVHWQCAEDGWYKLLIHPESELVKYFEPNLKVGIDVYGVIQEPIMGFVHIKKRQTGTKAAYEQAMRISKYYNTLVLTENGELPSSRRRSILQRITHWFKDLWSGRRGK